MDKFIDLFLKAAKPLHKAGILLTFFIILIIIDTFTSYPSLSFTKDKFDTIETLYRVSNDTSLPENIRIEAQIEIKDISDRHSLRHYILFLFDKVKNMASIKAHINPPIRLTDNANALDMIIYVIKWLFFVVVSGLFSLSILLFMGKADKGNPNALKKRSDKIAYAAIASLVVISNILSIIVINIIHTKYVYWTAFITQFVFIAILGNSVRLITYIKRKRASR